MHVYILLVIVSFVKSHISLDRVCNERNFYVRLTSCIEKSEEIDIMEIIHTIDDDNKQDFNRELMFQETDLLYYAKFNNVKYVIQKCIGYGGQGPVFLVQHNNTDSAVKFIINMKSFYEQALDKIIEYQKNNSSASNKVMRIYEKLKENNITYYRMEFIKGKELQAYSRDVNLRQKLNVDHLIRSVIEVARELHNDYGIVHRDFKAKNIMIRDDTMDIVMIDLDMALILKDHNVLRSSGTTSYFAPEMFFIGRDFRKDLWAVGKNDNPLIKQEYYNIGAVIFNYLFKSYPYYGKKSVIMKDKKEENEKALYRRFFKWFINNKENFTDALLDPIMKKLKKLRNRRKIGMFFINSLNIKPAKRKLIYE